MYLHGVGMIELLGIVGLIIGAALATKHCHYVAERLSPPPK